MNIELLFSNFDLLNTPEKIQKLKQAILQLAIQGKLVPQDSNDEPASELIKKIKAEKAKLIKEGKLKREKSLPPISDDEIPYKIPHGWKWVRLGDISNKIHYGYTASADSTIKEIKLLRITDIQNNKVNWEKVPGCEIEENESIKFLLSKDDLLIARTGGTIGKSFLVHELPVKAVFASYLIRIIPSSLVISEFLKMFLDSPLYWNQLINKSMGTGQPNVNGVSLSQLLLPLPKQNEQKRIVEKVDELFSIADEIESKLKMAGKEIVHLNKSALNQLLESKDEEDFRKNFEFIVKSFDLLYSDERNVKELRLAILQLAVQGKLVPQDLRNEPASELIKKIKAQKEKLIKEGKQKKEKTLVPISHDEFPYELPQGWQWVRLGEISRDVNYGTSHKSSAITQGVPILGMGNVREGNIQYDSYKYVPSHIKDLPRLFLKKNDMLFNRTNSYDLVGKTGIYKKEDNSFTFASYLIRVSFLHNLTNPEYINIFFNTSLCRKTQIEPEITKQTNQANFNGTKLKNLLVPLPPFTEQKRIVAKVDQLMKICDELESKISKSKEKSKRLVDAILHASFC